MKWPAWLVGTAVAADDEGNEIILHGNESKTISEHCGRQKFHDRVCLFCAVVCGLITGVLGIFFPILRNHCLHTYYKHNPGDRPKTGASS